MKRLTMLLLATQLLGCSKQIYLEHKPCEGYYETYELDKTNGFIKLETSKDKPSGSPKFICVKCGDVSAMGYKWVYKKKVIRNKIIVKNLLVL